MANAQNRTPQQAVTKVSDTTVSAVVTWGDSIGNGMGLSIGSGFAQVTNLGRDGARLSNAEPLRNLPKGAAVLMSIGTNDIQDLINASQERIDGYAKNVITAAKEVRRQGAIPVIIGIQAPLAPYTGNPVWSQPGFLENWTKAMQRVNEAIARTAKAEGIAWSPVQGRVAERDSDNLHYTPQGFRHIVDNALKDAGLRR